MLKGFFKRTAFAVLFLIPAIGQSWLPPAKISGFKFTQCSSTLCYLFSGMTGFTSKMNSIFSAENTDLKISSNDSVISDQYMCQEFTYNLSQEIITCTDHLNARVIELNLVTNSKSVYKSL